ncbi:AsnC family transcriptional regulator [Desulfuribacillus stibiiarsenatis]|uniref:AsnC family transcriptional regulator n=1 Tax=Desulfuribacillus stibiiarsenatis TaxID=1390249 RepID=A0A1E5L6P3_9FIRM|nr:Lrp/AsnC family transcriptional regulator [Desulfuribacillus stibiiarsenatis]OEH85728.1 AsnC family transcriptional regulator [Desulfuribacillus stibiiarsenatis]
MTEIHLQIAQLIRDNSKITHNEIAKMLDLEEQKVTELVREMEENGTIVKYTAMINWEKVSSEQVIAMIDVKVAPKRGQGFDALAERIYRFPEVQSVYLMSGSYDLSVVVEGDNLKQVAEFVRSRLAPLEDVVSTTTHFILKKYKENGVIFDNSKNDERLVVSP